MDEGRATCAQARIADSIAVMRLLNENPGVVKSCSELCKPYVTGCWRPDNESSFWIASDGAMTVCHTDIRFRLDEVMAFRLGNDAYRRRLGCTLTAGSREEMVEAELGLHGALDE